MMTPGQEFLLQLLQEIRDICVKNDITYFIGAGTLIGAVRHDGFLPWDDDADLYMTYDNWLKFKEACKTDLPPNRLLLAPDTDPTYNNILPRYMATSTTAFHSHQILNTQDPAGEIIDIFILDPIADGEEALAGYSYDLMLYTEVVNYVSVPGRRFGVKPEDYEHYLKLEEEKGKEYVRKELEERLCSWHSEEGSRCIQRWGGDPIVYQRYWWTEGVLHKFETDEFLIPKGTNEYLTVHYGDEWSIMPPSAERPSHNMAQLLNVPYTEALEYYEPPFDPDELLKLKQQRKIQQLTDADRDYALINERVGVRAVQAKLELETAIENAEDEYDRALKERDGAALSRIMAPFIAWQTSREAVGCDDWPGSYRFHHPIIADVTLEQLEACCLALMYTERIGKAFKVLNAYKILHGHTLPARLALLDGTIELFRKGTDAFQYGRWEEGRGIAHQLVEAHPNSVGFVKLEATYLAKAVELEASAENLTALKDYVAEALKKYPDDGYFQKLYGDYLYARGAADAALEAYKIAIENTTNGFALLDVRRRFGLSPSWMTEDMGGTGDGVNPEEGDDESSRVIEDGSAKAGDECQTYLFNLLAELTKLCDEHDIEYFLSPNACRAMFLHDAMPDRLGAYVIYLKAPQFKQLLELLKSGDLPKNRALRYMGNDPMHTKMSLHYVGLDSTHINLNSKNHYENPGLYVAARCIGSKHPKGLVSRAYGGWLQQHKWKPTPGLKPKLAMAWATFVVGGDKQTVAGEKITQARLKGQPKQMDIYEVDDPDDSNKIEAAALEKVEKREFNGVTFRTPADIKHYLRLLPRKKADYEGALIVKSQEIVSANMPFTKMQQSGCIDPTYGERRQEILDATEQERETQRLFNHQFSQIKLACTVKGLAVDLLPQKENLASLRQAGDYEAMLEILSDYRWFVETAAGKIGLAFDDDLWSMMQEALEHDESDEGHGARIALKLANDRIAKGSKTTVPPSNHPTVRPEAQ